MADFLRLYRGTEPVNAALSPQQKQDYLRHFQDWIISLTKAGKISSCAPLAQGGRTLAGPRSLITEGPYAEAKDLVGGYTVISAENLDEATEIARGCPFLVVGGTVEIRPVPSEEAEHTAHTLDPVEGRDKMHLRGAGIGKAHIDAAADQGAYQAFRAVHDRLSVCLLCDPPARLTR